MSFHVYIRLHVVLGHHSNPLRLILKNFVNFKISILRLTFVDRGDLDMTYYDSIFQFWQQASLNYDHFNRFYHA